MIEPRIRRVDQTPLSRSAFLYLFAERQVRRSRVLSRAGGQPAVRASGGRLLRLVDLERWLVAWAVWELFDAGVSFDLFTDDHRRHASKATLWLTAETEPSAARPGTLAGSLVPHLGCEPQSAQVVVSSWAEDRWPLPVSAIVDLVGREIGDSGLPTTRSVPRPWQRWVLNRVIPSPVCTDAELALLSGRFDELGSSWRAFRRANPDEVDALFGGVSRALRFARPIIADAGGGG